MKGIVISNNLDKTITVNVNRTKQHPLYKKRYNIDKKYQVHDPKNKFKIGDSVEFKPCRPISKKKKWKVIY